MQLVKHQVWRLHIKCTRTFATHKLFLKVAESIPVPNWSTSFKIPWTFAFILKTWSDNDDCKFWNALSSRDCGIDEDSGRDGGARPASISWKLMLLVVTPLLRVSLRWCGWWVRPRMELHPNKIQTSCDSELSHSIITVFVSIKV